VNGGIVVSGTFQSRVFFCAAIVVFLCLASTKADGPADEVVQNLLAGKWEAVFGALNKIEPDQLDPIDRFLLGQACYATNRNNRAFALMFSPDVKDSWRDKWHKWTKELVDSHPSNAVSCYIYTKTLDDDLDAAEEYINKAISLDPKFALAWSSRGWLRTLQKEYDKAIADHTKAIELDPALVIACHLRGRAWQCKKDNDKAIADFSKAIQLKPDYYFAYNFRVITWQRNGNYDKAIADCDKMIEFAPPFCPLAHHLRGWTWLQKGECDKAIADLDRAIEIDPEHANSYYFRGFAWASKGERTNAISDFGKAVELKPSLSSSGINEIKSRWNNNR
jgi:tetratricopeptide (TPR) repeat protein